MPVAQLGRLFTSPDPIYEAEMASGDEWRYARILFAAGFRPGDALVFGKESKGLDDALLERFPDDVYGIPTLGPVRSLNLANAVGIVLYEALRQIGAFSSTTLG